MEDKSILGGSFNKNEDHEQYLSYLEIALEEAERNGVLPYALELAWNDYKESKGW